MKGDITIDDLKLSVRAYNSLKKSGLTTVAKLMTLTLEDFFALKNMGKKTAYEVYDLLHGDCCSDETNKGTSKLAVVLSENFLNFSKFVYIKDVQFNTRATNALSNSNITTLYELVNIDLYSIDCLGIGTIKEIKKAISDYIATEFQVEFNNDSINDNFLNLDISRFPNYKKISLFKTNVKTIKEGFNLFLTRLENIVKFEDIESYLLYKGFNKFKKMSSIDVSELILTRFKEKKIRNREIDIFSQRGLGITLETLGAEYNLERERIRQIDKKTVEKIKEFWEKDEILDYIGHRNWYCIEENDTSLNDFLFQLLIRRLDELSNYVSVEIDSVLYFYKNNFFEQQKNEFEQIYNFIFEHKVVEKVDLPPNTIEKKLLTHFYALNNFEEVGTRVILKTSKKEKIIAFTKKKTVIDISKNNISNEMEEFFNLFDVEIESERAFSSLVMEVCYSIGDGKYTSSDNDPIIEETILNDIFDYINKNKFVKAGVLYNKYKDRIENLLSPGHLYGFLKKKFGDKYNFGGTNLVIATLDTKTSNAARVYDLLLNSTEPINRDKIMLLFGLDTIGLNIIDSQNEDIIKWGKDKYYLKSKIDVDLASKESLGIYLDKTSQFLPNDLLTYSQIKKLNYIDSNFIKDKNDLNSFILNCPINLFDDFKYDNVTGIYRKETKNDYGLNEFEL